MLSPCNRNWRHQLASWAFKHKSQQKLFYRLLSKRLAKAIHDLIKYQSRYRLPHRKQRNQQLWHLFHAESFIFVFLSPQNPFQVSLPRPSTHYRSQINFLHETDIGFAIVKPCHRTQTLIIKYSLTKIPWWIHIICPPFPRMFWLR